MFLSLKGAIGRNPMLNRVGQKLLQSFGGASAAYSLRNLASNIASVVRVRRASDNSEKDFSAADISSGAITGWVNSQIVPPLDIRELDSNGERTGALVEAAAAYSLRNLSSSYTGDVVVVRRSSDDAEELFTAAEVADGTLTTWVGAGNDGYVVIWYDQSGNGNHATQTTNASQPKIVDGGSLVSGGLSIGSGQHLSTTLSGTTFALNNASSFVLGVASGGQGVGTLTTINNTAQFSTPYRYSSTQGFRYGGESASSQPRDNSVQLFTLIGGSTTAEGFANGTSYRSLASVSNTFTNPSFKIGSYTNNLITGKVEEIIIYNSDQSDNRTAIEANIGDHYDIDLPSGVDTGYDQVDGFVETWYDQSGNGNDAVQDVAGSQPKIVDAGVLVSGGLDFDGVDDGLFTVSNFTDTLQSATFFAVTKDDTTSGTASMVRIRPSGDVGTFDGITWQKVNNVTYAPATFIDGANATVSASVGGQGTRNTSKNLNTLIYQQSQILAYENGALDATLNYVRSGSVPVGDVTLVDQLWLGQNFDDNARPFNGTMSEVIIYFTDQSANRPAIETNINNQYDIY